MDQGFHAVPHRGPCARAFFHVPAALFHKCCMTGIPGVTPSWSRFGMSGLAPDDIEDPEPVCLSSLPEAARLPGKRRRQPRYGPHYSDAAIQACLTIKVLFGLPLRQTTGLVAGLVESLLGLVDLDCDVADDSRLCRRQKTLSVAIAAQGRYQGLSGLKRSAALAGGQHGHTALASRPKGRANGTQAGTAAPNAASGARPTSVLMSTHWKYALSK